MPKVRNRGGVPDSPQGPPQWAGSPQVNFNYSLSNATMPLSSLFPDVPLNPEHRYCTPPPLDPGYDEYSQLSIGDHSYERAVSPSDFVELFSEEPPVHDPGSKENPILIPDEDRRTPRKAKRRIADEQAGPPRRSPRRLPQTTRASTPGPSRSTASAGASTSSSVASSSRPSRKTAKVAQSGSRSSKAAERRRAAANGYSPLKSSPLTQVAYRAPSERPLSPTPALVPLPVQTQPDRWYIPPRKHSTGSVSATSESSYDSDSDSDSE